MSNHQLFRKIINGGYHGDIQQIIGGAERNSTSFTKENLEILRKIKKEKDDPLRYHQRLVYEYVVESPDCRGILIYHVMGAGKTISAVAIAEGLLEKKPDRHIIIMAAKSLHDNMRQNVEKYMKLSKKDVDPSDVSKHVNNSYQFISLNASNMLTQVHRAMHKGVDTTIFDDDVVTAEEAEEFGKLDKLGDLEGSVLIIDEAHNLFNAISNGSKNAIGLYRLIMEAKDIKVVFLTGSPITNDPFEIALAMNMIAGPQGKEKYSLFGEDYMDFTKHFVGAIKVTDENCAKDPDGQPIPRVQPHIINREKFMNRIVGLVSYYGADDPEQRALYPEQLDWQVRRIKMGAKQYAAYINARDREREETQRGSKFTATKQPLQKPGGVSSSYRVRSRQFSNFLYPESASRTWKNERGYVMYEKYIDKLDNKQLMDQNSGGKGSEDKMGLEVWSPKLLDMLHNIQRHCPFKFISVKPGKTVAKTESGVKKVKTTKKKIPSKKGKGEVNGGAPSLSIAVRPIMEEDWDEIESQFNANFEDKYKSKPGNVGLVALDDEEVIGWAVLNPKTQYVRYLRVVPAYQRRGIGTILWTLLTEKYRSAKFTLSKKYGPGRLDTAKRYGFKVVGESTKAWHLERKVSGGAESHVRPLTNSSSDIEAIEMLIDQTGGTPYAEIEEPKSAYLIEIPTGKTKQAIGFIILRPGYASNKKQRHDTAYIMNMGIADAERQKGYGSTLIKAVMKEHPRLYLKVVKSDKLGNLSPVKKFYEKNGFSVYRVSPEKWYMRILGGKGNSVNNDHVGDAPITSKGGTGPGLVYSQFIDSGVKLLGRALEAHGFIEIKDMNDALKHSRGPAYAIISGQVDPDLRTELIKIYNSPENKHGEHLAMLLVTSTGAEGLDLKRVRHIHIMEPYWHWSRIAQVLFRGIRMGSHVDLPKGEQNVQPYMYLSDYPGTEKLGDLADEMGKGADHIRKQMEKEDTTDVDLYTKAKQNQLLIDSFLGALQDASIDCAIHYPKRDCRVCSPTDEPLFIPELGKDMRVKSPCVPIEEKKVKAKSVVITAEDPNGDPIKREYMYVVTSDEPDGGGKKLPKIFDYIEALDGYKEIFADHPHYEDAYAAIKKRERL